METARYILNIFKHYTAIIFSWGFSRPIAIEECEEGLGGLMFNVEGFKFKGQVKVMLNFIDTFDIYLMKNGTVVDTIKDVYLDSLVRVIDSRVEYTPDYAEKVKNEYGLRARVL